MAKTLTIKIKPEEEALEGFRRTFKALAAGRRISRRDGVYFTSIEAARNLLTPNRLALLRAIRTERPGSTYELAKRLNRDLKNVQQDLRAAGVRAHPHYAWTGHWKAAHESAGSTVR